MDQDETVESVPWSELLDDVEPGQDIRRIAYLAAGLLGAVVLGAVIARAWWSPSPPVVIAPGIPVAADVLEQMQTGRFDIHLDHRGLEPSVNRLVLGMLASALFVGAALMLSFKVPPPIFGISAPGLAAAVISFSLGLRLWRDDRAPNIICINDRL